MIITRKTSAITRYFKPQLADNQTVAPCRCYRAKKMKKFSLEKVIEILKKLLTSQLFLHYNTNIVQEIDLQLFNLHKNSAATP